MHVAAAFKVPTITIFGPTKFTETNQWNNPNGKIVTKKLRVCTMYEKKLSFKAS